MRAPAGCLLASVLILVHSARAQAPAPGDYVVSDQRDLAGGTTFGRVYRVPALAGASTILAAATEGHFKGVIMAANNTDLILPLAKQSTIPPLLHHLVRLTPAGALTTLGPVGGDLPVKVLGDAELDQDGTYVVVANSTLGPDNALYRFDPVTNTSSLITAVPGNPTHVTIDGTTGDYVVGNTAGSLLRVNRATLAITTIVASGISDQPIDFDPISGNFMAYQMPGIVRVTPGGTRTTVTTGASGSQGFRIDDTTGDFLNSSSSFGGVALWTSAGALVRTRPISNGPVNITGVEIHGSRKVSGSGAATPGSTYTIRFSFPASPNAVYRGLMSFGERPGIPLNDGTRRVVSLDFTSPLFGLTLTSGGIPGITTGFLGNLDGSGQATGTIAIPSILPPGVRMFVSAFAVNGAMPFGIETANTWGFTTNP
jgi:hypothetical protein